MNNNSQSTINSDNYYKIIAPSYQELSGKRIKYLTAIENLVAKYATCRIEKYLDAGAGDGLRALRIAKAVGADATTLLDSCSEMLPEPNFKQGITTLCMNIGELNQPDTYDLITCLWNVFGHIPSYEERLSALTAMREALKSEGRLIIDVNNRHNFEYGSKNVIKNLIQGLVKPNQRGNYNLNCNGEMHTVHIASHLEMLGLIRKAKLNIVAQHFVSYRSGALARYPWQGQLFYVLSR
jgi:2-polyprenyl-3-methyl-5-hydroxy-6-metoxy-1,4-benzoquinol methylase